MLPTLSPQDFVAKWRQSKLKESAAAQEHFIDLCRLVGHPTPAESDPTGESFTFEAGVSKQAGGQGWADVWKKGYFAWEYKGKHKDLDAAYQQLLQYRESLLNPPLLVVSDMDRIIIHTNFVNTIHQVVTLTLDDLLTPAGMAQLRALFYEPDYFKAPQTTEQVTEQAARQFSQLAELHRQDGANASEAAHFLIRLLFCLFAEDVGLLPKDLFTSLVKSTRRRPEAFTGQLHQLFAAMSTGGWFGVNEISYFNGGLFDDDRVLALNQEGMDILAGVCTLDWADIEPSIFGTLFERSLDPSKRSQLGAHYTSRNDILLIIEPVLMAPQRRRWEEVQLQAQDLMQRRDAAATRRTRENRQKELTSLLTSFAYEISQVRVLDPACGSGNFLYVALRQLLDLEKEVITFARDVNVGSFFPSVSPEQLYGIEINEYAHELAQTTIWIGYIQWLHDNGFGVPGEPILKPLDNIKQMDAILAYDNDGNPIKPEWPEADVVIGNPPFLGAQRLRRELGDQYVDDLFVLYADQVPGAADLVCYWLERARDLIATAHLRRAGLLATQSIRAGASRRVIDHIKKSGDIFMAWSDRPWILDGAAVRVSMIGFDRGEETKMRLDGQSVPHINSDLTSEVDLTQSVPLSENQNICFRCDEKGGPFDIDEDRARRMLLAPSNPNLKPNSDVVRPYINALDVLRRPRDRWIIDFGSDMSVEEAALYELPFEYIRRKVKTVREQNKNDRLRTYWWIHRRPTPDMRQAVSDLSSFIVTPRVAKHRVFVWMPGTAIPDSRLYAFARDDDYFFGVLHSCIHEVWSLATSSRHGDGGEGGRPTYNNTTCFETFPFPWPPGTEKQDDPLVQAVAQAARELDEKRNAWLNPPGLSEKELKKRTLTNLYNQRPTWLDLAHQKLDKAVFAAYGWPNDLSDEEILERLLALNSERSEQV